MVTCPVRVGDTVRTAESRLWGESPEGDFLVTGVFGPCHCPPYSWTMRNMAVPEGDEPEFPTHWHLTCRRCNDAVSGDSYLTIDETMHDRAGELIWITSKNPEPVQFDLFQEE